MEMTEVEAKKAEEALIEMAKDVLMLDLGGFLEHLLKKPGNIENYELRLLLHAFIIAQKASDDFRHYVRGKK